MEKISVTTQTVSCCGPDPALGHPLVYLDLSVKDQVPCPYCGRYFVYEPQDSSQLSSGSAVKDSKMNG